MIARLEGTLAHLDIRYAIVSVGPAGQSVGYKAYLTEETLEKISHGMGKPVTLWTYTAVREDALDLYGFLTKPELDLFEMLITFVSGIGPKSALAILNGSSIETLKDGIASGDPTHLTKVSGVGKKMAEKIVLGLKDKLADHIQTDTVGGTKEGSFAIDALVSLGYSERESRDVLKKLPKDLTTSQEIVKEAIKLLGKGN
jgi:Holliday junction DNA helicase RuvA